MEDQPLVTVVRAELVRGHRPVVVSEARRFRLPGFPFLKGVDTLQVPVYIGPQRPGWKAVRRQRKLPVTQDQSASRRKGCLQRPRSERQIPMAPGTSSEDTSLVECKR